MLLIALLSAVILCTNGKNEEYMGFKVYNVKLETEAQAARFYELKGDLTDFWRKPSLKHNVIGRAMLPPSQTDWFEERLARLNITKDIFIEDVYDYLTVIEKNLRKTARVTAFDDDVDDNDTDESIDNETDTEEETEEDIVAFDFNAYYRYDQILEHIDSLEEAYSDSSINVTVEEFGRTEYNRPLVFLKISQANTQEVDRPVVIIESGLIPREWITIPAAMNIVNRILENATFLEKADWIVVPVANPDGYEYSHTNNITKTKVIPTSEKMSLTLYTSIYPNNSGRVLGRARNAYLRLWTKSLSTQSNLGFICPGVNINRNFDISWQVSDSSSSPCSHLFAGYEPFSEIESQMIKHLLDTYNERIKLYISLQNSGGFISYPWQYEKAASGMFRQHLFLGFDMINAMNDDYILDVGWSALGDSASGTGSDYAQKNGVLYSLNIDVVQRGDDGVNIPEDEIVDVIEDVWRAVAVAASAVLSE